MAWHFGIDIREASLKNSEAQLIRKGNVGVIRIRHGEKDTPRGRFSIGHEIGHWKLHPDQNQYWICTAEQIHQYKGNWMEVEANAFSSELLMPTPVFRPFCQKGTFGFVLADRLSSLFGTSLQATALRMIDETPEPAIVVLSDGDKVCWSKRNQRKLPDFAFHIPRDMDLHDESLAWSASIDGDQSGTVDAKVWFPNLPDAWRYTVYEDARNIEAYGLALSLIVVHEE
ncbi:MAG TPA: ImmA/IrrE family metallo-endopeptidase [Fimbriimonadaceae bacterium]|nr:ImmA/IrrE family metallo-endopeptidase [Fimbriimonadaceae bacterium]